MSAPQKHHVPVTLGKGCGLNSLARWATSAATHLVLFVHGFGGSAKNTWPDFPSLLPERDSLPRFDVLFYGYNGLTQQVHSSALELGTFLETFLSAPETLINRSIPPGYERHAFHYERIVFVAHSLGAVVVRRALLDIYEDRQPPPKWLDQVRLVLMAPAHKGAFTAKNASAMLSSLGDVGFPVFKLLGFYGLHKMPLLSELQENSLAIKCLHEDTQAAIKDYELEGKPVPGFIKAHSVLWANGDLVVMNARFGVDPRPEQIDADHLSVCKPRELEHRALHHVWGAL